MSKAKRPKPQPDDSRDDEAASLDADNDESTAAPDEVGRVAAFLATLTGEYQGKPLR